MLHTLKPPPTSPRTFSTGIGVLSNITSQAENQMNRYLKQGTLRLHWHLIFSILHQVLVCIHYQLYRLFSHISFQCVAYTNIICSRSYNSLFDPLIPILSSGFPLLTPPNALSTTNAVILSSISPYISKVRENTRYSV